MRMSDWSSDVCSSDLGTPAADMDGQIPAEVMDERLARLQSLINRHQAEFNAATVGRRTDILLERKGRHPGQLIGKTPWLQSVHVTAPELSIGDIDRKSTRLNSSH